MSYFAEAGAVEPKFDKDILHEVFSRFRGVGDPQQEKIEFVPPGMKKTGKSLLVSFRYLPEQLSFIIWLDTFQSLNRAKSNENLKYPLTVHFLERLLTVLKGCLKSIGSISR